MTETQKVELEAPRKAIINPPSFDEVKAAGYPDDVAKTIVEREAHAASLRVPPYGTNTPIFGEGGKLVDSRADVVPADATSEPVKLSTVGAMGLSEHDTFHTVRGRRRMSPRERRGLQGHLGGVRLVVVGLVQGADGKHIPVGTDITEEAQGLSNLPMLLRRGVVKADPPVDYSRIQVAPSTDPSTPPMFAKSQEHVDEMSKLKPREPVAPVEPQGGAGDAPPGGEGAGKGEDGKPPQGAGDALRAELAMLTEKDSAKHVLAVVGKVMDVPKNTTKKQALELRDQFLARPPAPAEPPPAELKDVAVTEELPPIPPPADAPPAEPVQPVEGQPAEGKTEVDAGAEPPPADGLGGGGPQGNEESNEEG